MLRIHTFGGCFLERDGVRLDAVSGHRKGLALLAIVAASELGVSRDVLLGLLWPESSEERARTSLRQLIHSLRQQLAAPELLQSPAELRLDPDVISSDVAELRAAARSGDHETVAALYSGPFLDGFYLKGAGEFERWVAGERAARAADAARSMEALAGEAQARGDSLAAVEWWRRLANAEPLSARATAGLMRSLDAAGDRPAALLQARIHETLVQQELGGPVDPAIRDLVTELGRSAPPARPDATGVVPATRGQDGAAAEQTAALPPRSPAAAAAPMARRFRMPLFVAAAALVALSLAAYRSWQGADGGARHATSGGGTRPSDNFAPSIAVLPFANLSGQPGDEHYSDGLTDELIGTLGKIPGLRVTGRTSAHAVRDRGLDARAIGELLGVATVLEGSWRRVDNRLRVHARLVAAADGSVMWTERYDRELTDVLAVQEEIARAIARALRVPLSTATGTRGASRPSPDPAAHELYLRGRYVFGTRIGRDGVLQAARFFEEAVALDASYAEAYSGLSDAYTRLAVFGHGPPSEAFARAKAAAHRALALDSSLAEAHVSLAHVELVADFAWDDAERRFRRAIALDPGYTFARAPFAIQLGSQGRYAEAIAQIDSARAIDPLAPWAGNVLGRLYVMAGRPDDAIRTLRGVLELNPHMDLAHQQLGHAYLLKREPAEAIAAFREAAALSGARDSAQLAYAYAVLGQREEAERIVATLVDPTRGGTPLPYHIAMAYAGLGDVDAAFTWLERGYAERASFMSGVKAEPGFRSLHADPRWPVLLRRMGLSA